MKKGWDRKQENVTLGAVLIGVVTVRLAQSGVVINSREGVYPSTLIQNDPKPIFEAELVEFDGEDDHVHLLVNYPSIREKLWGGALWSPSYFAGSCGGAPIEIVRQYIEQQQAPH